MALFGGRNNRRSYFNRAGVGEASDFPSVVAEGSSDTWNGFSPVDQGLLHPFELMTGLPQLPPKNHTLIDPNLFVAAAAGAGGHSTSRQINHDKAIASSTAGGDANPTLISQNLRRAKAVRKRRDYRSGKIALRPSAEGDPYFMYIRDRYKVPGMGDIFQQIIEDNSGPENFAKVLFDEIHAAPGVDAWDVIDKLRSMGGSNEIAASHVANLQSQYDRRHPLEAAAWGAGRFAWSGGEALADTLAGVAMLGANATIGIPVSAAEKMGFDVPNWAPNVDNIVVPVSAAANRSLGYIGDVVAGDRNVGSDARQLGEDIWDWTANKAGEIAQTHDEGGGLALWNRYSDPLGYAAGAAASVAAGPGAARAAGLVTDMSHMAQVEKGLAQGFRFKDAIHLADLYKGEGHHFLQKKIGYKKLNLPRSVMESRFNVLKPANITRGEMYTLHAKADPHYSGSRLTGKGKGSGWSAKRLGIETAGPLGRLWLGSPRPLKIAVGSPFGALGGGAWALGGVEPESSGANDEMPIDLLADERGLFPRSP
jgi:hypothetical protein